MSLVNKDDTAEGASADRGEKADRVCKELAALAVKALLDEAALFPKPGLVDPVSQGAHSDMDFTTLVRSAAALQQGFYECARIGYESAAPLSAAAQLCTRGSGIPAAGLLLQPTSATGVQTQGTVHAAPFSAAVQPCMSSSGTPTAELLPQLTAAAVRKRLRTVGLALEKTMFEETRGVNTHKGAIFIFAYLLGAAGQLFCGAASSRRAVGVSAFGAGRSGSQAAAHDAEDVRIEGTESTGHRYVMELTKTLCAWVQVLATGLVAEDMARVSTKRTLTHGEQVFLWYDCTGIRGEVEAGLPSVRRNTAYLAELTHLTQREAYLYTLLHIIAENEDTNVLFRVGPTALRDLQTRCASIVASGVTGATLYAAVEALDNYCIERHISPGGSADLFAAVLFCRSLSGLAEER